MVNKTQRPEAPLQHINSAEHRRLIAQRANVGLPIDGTKPMLAPLVVKDYETLPAAAIWQYGIAYDTDNSTPVISDGTNWLGLGVIGISSDGSNNTTDTLAGAATFTGTAEENGYPDVMVSCLSDVAGTLFFEFSNDGTNWDRFPSGGFDVAANTHEFHVAVKGPRQFRAVFVNGASAQSSFRLYTYYGQFRQPNAPLNQTLGRDADAILVRPTNTQDEISIGLRGGVSQFNKFGYLEDLDTSNGEQVVWANGSGTKYNGSSPTLLTSAETFNISYDGTAGGTTDGAGTTGATELTFFYIDSDGSAAVSAHTLGTDGTDTTSFSGFGINRCVVSASGSADVNVSDIEITATSTGTRQAFIPAGNGTTQQAVFYTPADARALAKSLYISVGKISGSSPKVTFRGWVWNRNIQCKYEIFETRIDTSVENTVTFTDACNFPLTPTDVLWFTAETDTNNTRIQQIRFSTNIYNN